MPSFIRAHVVGHCGKDLFINDKGNMASFSIGTSYKEGSEYKSLWVKVVCFGQQIDFLKANFSTGRLVHAEGDIRLGGYKDKSGAEVKNLELVYSKVMFLDKKDKDYDAPAEAKLEDIFIDDDIPF